MFLYSCPVCLEVAGRKTPFQHALPACSKGLTSAPLPILLTPLRDGADSAGGGGWPGVRGRVAWSQQPQAHSGLLVLTSDREVGIHLGGKGMELGGRLAHTNPISTLPYSQSPDFIRGLLFFLALPFFYFLQPVCVGWNSSSHFGREGNLSNGSQ